MKFCLLGGSLGVVLLLCAAAGAAEEPAGASVEYLPLDAPPGVSQAVVVQGAPLVYTRQLLPLNAEGKLVGEDSVEQQAAQVLDNLQAVLADAGSGLDKLVRVNICALSHEAAERLREQLSQRTGAAVRPAITTVLTPLAHRQALVAVDAIAVGADVPSEAVGLRRCKAVAGDDHCADAAVMPAGGAAYLSGQPAQGGLAVSAVARSLSSLSDTLKQLDLGPEHVVQLKVFLRPASSAAAVLEEVKRFFPEQMVPPVVLVEWIASMPVEIELVAAWPPGAQAAEAVRYYNPPGVSPSPVFSRVALVRGGRQIFIAGLSAREPGDGPAQANDVFEQIQTILKTAGSDLRHLAKATYYVMDDDASRGIDLARRELYDPQRPPAASKVTVHAVGGRQRTLAVDVIAVPSQP